MASWPISGSPDEALVAAATDVRHLIAGLDPDGDNRIFYLQTAMFSNEHASATGIVEFWDSDESTGVTAGTQRGPSVHVGPGQTVEVNFGGKGLKFVTNCCVSASAGTFSALSQFGRGVLE